MGGARLMARLPNLANGPPDVPRTSIGVRRYGVAEHLIISFDGDGGGHAEVVSVADAEALAERLLAWVAVVRFEQLTRK